MKIEVWPFLIGRNRTLGYRSIISPPFLFEAGVSTLLAEAIGGRDSQPDTVTYREIQGSPVGNISLFFRIGQAKGQAYGIEDAEVLKDEGGRAIRLIEGFVLRGRIQAIDDFVVTHKDFYATHEAVKHAYHEFWYATDDSFPEKTSQPFTLFPEDPANKRLVLNTMAPFIVKHTSQNQDYTQAWRRYPILISGVALVLLILIGITYYALTRTSPSTSMETMSIFCNILQQKHFDYEVTYNTFTSNAQIKITKQTFTRFLPQITQITSCTPAMGSAETDHTQIAILTLNYANGAPSNTLKIILKQDDKNNWKIDKLQNIETQQTLP